MTDEYRPPSIADGTVPCQTCKGSGCNPTPKWSRT
jgi:hypothetical protein